MSIPVNDRSDSGRSPRVIIVGGGPIGLELAVALERAGISYALFEAKGIGSTIYDWPRNTHFYSAPERVAIAGVPFHSADQYPPTGEEYLAYLRSVVEQFDLNVYVYESVCDISSDKETFHITTRPLVGEEREWECSALVLATGSMAMPNRMNIPGDDLPHVSYSFTDPSLYFRRSLLVVGGGNSALEAALRSWRAGAHVTISYRNSKFDPSRTKPQLAPEITMLIEKGEINFLPSTQPASITRDGVALARTDSQGEVVDGKEIMLLTDAVLFAIGYRADMSLFRKAGVKLTGAEERPDINSDTMETNVPGIYVAGTAAGGTQTDYDLFIATCHHHVEKIARALGVSSPSETGSIPQRSYPFTPEDLRNLNLGEAE